MNRADGLGFWRDCVDRREVQLRLHQESLDAIPKDKDHEHLHAIQAGFLSDMRFKLNHAKAMFQFFQDLKP